MVALALDAQMKRSPWVQDVAYHVTASVDSADRPHWERELLMHYLRCLASEGVAGVPSFDEAWRTYRRELVYGLFIFLINDTRFQTEATNTAVAACFGAAVLEHRSFNLLLD
jgi:hypothetical protein